MLTTVLGIEYTAELSVAPEVDCGQAGIKPARLPSNVKDSPPHYQENSLY